MNMDAVVKETLRYLGIHSDTVEESLLLQVHDAIELVDKIAVKRHCVESVECRVQNAGVHFGQHFVVSQDLATHLKGCGVAILFAATLGADVDRLIGRDAVLHPSLAAMEQAAAAALIEQYCDDVCEDLQVARSMHHPVFLRTRFSPGYGDYSLEEQTFLLNATKAGKRIGVAHTQSFMLTPTKSVTAVIGVSKTPMLCSANRCAMCLKTDCSFRNI